MILYGVVEAPTSSKKEDTPFTHFGWFFWLINDKKHRNTHSRSSISLRDAHIHLLQKAEGGHDQHVVVEPTHLHRAIEKMVDPLLQLCQGTHIVWWKLISTQSVMDKSRFKLGGDLSSCNLEWTCEMLMQ